MTRKSTKKVEAQAVEVGARYYDADSADLKPVDNNEVPATENYTGSLD